MTTMYQKVWIEEVLPDYIRANILEEPSDLIIRSTTSNYQRQPGCLVLLDDKYPISGLLSVRVKRSREKEANVATIEINNFDNRYSGPNKHKVKANVPVSVFFGYEGDYIQKYQGFIDVVTLDTRSDQSKVTIECRDYTKQFIEQTISAGIYSEESNYFGYMGWHYEPRWEGSRLVKLPKKWTYEEVIRDICYHMGLTDVKPKIGVEPTELPSGEFTYQRYVKFGPEFRITLPSHLRNQPVTTNFVEQPPLDCIGKLVQAVLCEARFGIDGTLLVQPAKDVDAESQFYFKEERDLTVFREQDTDDPLTNVATVIGQTAREQAVTYPFAPVAVDEDVTLDKGQDIYGHTVKYPAVVAPENLGSLENPLVTAPVVAPGATFPSPEDNPENHPHYDFRMRMPNFSSPYKKQKVLSGSCPIASADAKDAFTRNTRVWYFSGEKEDAIGFTKHPIHLFDRFGDPMLVVCKERAGKALQIFDGCKKSPGPWYDPRSSKIQWDETVDHTPQIEYCGNTPIGGPEMIDNEDDGEEEEDENEITMEDLLQLETYRVNVTSSGECSYIVNELDELPESYENEINGYKIENNEGGEVNYSNPGPFLHGYKYETPPSNMPILDGMPSSGSSSYNSSCFRIFSFNAIGPDEYKDMETYQMIAAIEHHYLIMFEAVYNMTITTYSRPTGGTVEVVPSSTLTSDHYSYLNPISAPSAPLLDPESVVHNCTLEATEGGGFAFTVPYEDASIVEEDWEVVSTRTETVTFPSVYYTRGVSDLDTDEPGDLNWHFAVWSGTIDRLQRAINASRGQNLKVLSLNLQNYWLYSRDADANCIYWKWWGTLDSTQDTFYNFDVVDSGRVNQDGDPIYVSPNTYDSYSNPRTLITRDEFYKLSSDPTTVVIELLSDSVDLKSESEIRKLTENGIVVRGHNYFGSWAEASKKMGDNLMVVIQYSFHAIAASFLIASVTAAALGDPKGATQHLAAVGVAEGLGSAAFFAYSRYLGCKYAQQGRQISQQMTTIKGEVFGCRQEELHMDYNNKQAFNMFFREAPEETDPIVSFGTTNVMHESSRAAGEEPDNPYGPVVQRAVYDEFWYDDDNDGVTDSKVYIFPVTATNPAYGDAPQFPDGCYVTHFGWDTPEVGDKRIVYYYQGDPDEDPEQFERKERYVRFKVEAFGDHEGQSALQLLNKRFKKHTGTYVEVDDMWHENLGYEVLVDRTTNDVALTDYGLWYDFFQRRESWRPRIYKYVALIISKNVLKRMSKNGSLISETDFVASRSMSDENVFNTNRWGIVIPRGLNPEHYKNYRWIPEIPEDNIETYRIEENYLGVNVLHAGERLLVAHFYNQFLWSSLETDIRVWGKAFGKYAPSVIYYASEDDGMSIDTYGRREIKLQNKCINDYRVAKYLAERLVAGSLTTFDFTSTMKPYVKEGDVVTVKEETSGAIAGTFRTWDNSFKSPEERACTGVANALDSQKIEGVYNPRCAIASRQNNTLVACGSDSKPGYLLELDKASNPIWYAKTNGVAEPSFMCTWGGNRVVVGMHSSNSIVIVEYAEAQLNYFFSLSGSPNDGAICTQGKYLFVGTTHGISCIDLESMSLRFEHNIGEVRGIAASVWKTFDINTRQYHYDYSNTGILFYTTGAGITARYMFNGSRSGLGSTISTYSGVPTDNPGSLNYARSIDELTYLNRATGTSAASIHGIQVSITLDAQHIVYEAASGGTVSTFDLQFGRTLWEIDYMEDDNMKYRFPDTTARVNYINQFFTPVYAVRDVTNEVIISDSTHNKVYKVNPHGKFYVVSTEDTFDRSEDRDELTSKFRAVILETAMSIQLTNFGKNFINVQTEEQIEEANSVAAGVVQGLLPKNKYLVRLITSDKIVVAGLAAGLAIKVNDTVLIAFGYGNRDDCVIIGRHNLHDWTVETGEPVNVVDATNVEVGEYGQLAGENGSGGSTTNVDLSPLMNRIYTLERHIQSLGQIHGIQW